MAFDSEFGDVFRGVGRWHLIVNLVMCSECNLCHYKCRVSVTSVESLLQVSSLCYKCRVSVTSVKSLLLSVKKDLSCPGEPLSLYCGGPLLSRSHGVLCQLRNQHSTNSNCLGKPGSKPIETNNLYEA